MRSILLLCYLLVIFFIGCKKEDGDQKLLSVKDDIELLSQYFSAATTGVVSANTPLKYMLLHEVDQEIDDAALQKVITLNPSVDGKVALNNGVILSFAPQDGFKPDQTYEVTINLPLLDKAKYPNKVIYKIKTFKQDIAVELTGLLINDNNDATILVEARTADRVTVEKIKGMFASNGNISQVIETKSNTYEIEINFDSGIDDKSYINYDSKSIYVDKKGTLDLIEYSSSQFIPIFSRYNPSDQEFIIYFSQQLDPSQDLSGLVKWKNGAAKTKVNLNSLTVYIEDNQKNEEKQELSIAKGIKSKKGLSLEKDFTYNFDIAVNRPACKFLDDGIYFPTEGNFEIPIKLKALEAVRLVVIEIPQQNVQHYLSWQSLRYTDTYSMRMFGKPIYDEIVDVKGAVPDADGWAVYGIDLSKQIMKKPGSIYHLSLEFSPEHTTLACKEELKPFGTISRLPNADYFNEASFSDYNNYYDDYYYGYNYNWDNTDNPCDIGYYYNAQVQQKLAICSNFSIIAKKANKDFHFALASLLDLSPIQGAKVSLYDPQGEVITSGTSSANGLVTLKSTKGNASVAKFESGQDITYLQLNEAESNSMAEFDTQGDLDQTYGGIYIYTERDIWRPGDSIYLDVMLNNMFLQLPVGLPLTLDFYNPDRLLLKSHKTRVDASSQLIYSFVFHTNSLAKTGNYHIRLQLGPHQIRKNIRIETIKPNTTEIVFAIDQEKDRIIRSNTISGSIQSKYLTGFPAKNSTVEGFARASKIQQPFPKYKQYQFDIIHTNYEVSNIPLLNTKTNEEGKATFECDYNFADLNHPSTVQIEIEHLLAGGGMDKEGKSYKIYPHETYLGAKLVSGSGFGGSFSSNEKPQLELVSITQDEKLNTKPITISYTIYKHEKYWWVDKYSLSHWGHYQSNSFWEEINAGSKTFTGKSNLTLPSLKGNKGAYKILLTDNNSGHKTELFFNQIEHGQRISLENPEHFLVFTNKNEYTVGEDIKIDLPNIQNAQALISIERGLEVKEYFWYDLDKNSPLVLQAKDEWGPNTYLHVTIIQPYQKNDNDLPLRMYGIKNLTILGGNKSLEPQIDLPEKIESNTKYTFHVTEKNSQEMEYTIAFVDEGLLGITGFSTPNPHAYFNKRYSLLVKTWDIYQNLMAYFKGRFAGSIAIGGDAAYNPDAINEVNRFKAVVAHLGPFKLDAYGKNQHDINIPNYIGKLRIMIVATNQSKQGSMTKQVLVKNPLMLQTQFPRVLNVSDKLSLPVEIYKDDKSINNITVDAIAIPANILGLPNKQSITFGNKDQIKKIYDITVKPQAGPIKIDLTASGSGKKMTETTDINVNYPHGFSRNTINYTLKSGEKKTINAESKGFNETYTASVEVSGVLLPDFVSYSDRLIQYPYGCLEQTTSTGFGQLYLDKLILISPVQERNRLNNLQATIHKLSRMQNSDGSFKYWENGYYNAWADIYAGHYITELVSLNYLTPNDPVFKKWQDHSYSMANNFILKGSNDKYYAEREYNIQAYRLYILAVSGRPAKSAMNRFVTSFPVQNPTTWWLIAGAYQAAGYDAKAKEYINKAESLMKYKEYRNFHFGSDAREFAIAVTVLSQIPDQRKKAASYYAAMIEALNKYYYHNTQTMGWAFIASKAFNKDGLTATKDITYSIISDAKTNVLNHPYILAKSHPILGNTITIENKGKSDITLRFSEKFIDDQLLTPAVSQDLDMSVTFNNSASLPTTLNIGDQIKITVMIKNPSALPLHDLALNLKVPSGLELINPRLYETQSTNNNAIYQDFKDDRVYNFFSLNAGEESTFTYNARAVFTGDFFVPAIICEDMYKTNILAKTKSGRISVQ